MAGSQLHYLPNSFFKVLGCVGYFLRNQRHLGHTEAMFLSGCSATRHSMAVALYQNELLKKITFQRNWDREKNTIEREKQLMFFGNTAGWEKIYTGFWNYAWPTGLKSNHKKVMLFFEYSSTWNSPFTC